MNTSGPSGTEDGARPDVFERLYSMHHRTVLAYCARRVPLNDAWDAAAEVFLVAWRRIADVPPADEATGWLLGVAYRVLANQRRSRARMLRREHAEVVRDDAVPTPDEIWLMREEEAEVATALSRLREIDREVIQLAYWEELSPIEIAGVIGISRAAVDKRYSRAKRRLARELSDHRGSWLRMHGPSVGNAR